MICTSCDFENPTGAKFCAECGVKLQALCPDCGAKVLPESKFCSECGYALAARPADAVEAAGSSTSNTQEEARIDSEDHPTAKPVAEMPADGLAEAGGDLAEGEHRQVTALAIELRLPVGLTDETLAELLHSELNRFFETGKREVARYDGTINQYQKSGFLALFGVPVAHEDHPRRAVLAALGLRDAAQQRCAQLHEQHGVELTVHAGVATGQAVVGGFADAALGASTELASQLAQVAAPGTILLSDSTARSVGAHVNLKALEPMTLSGVSEPACIFQVEGAAEALDPAMFRRIRLSPYLGRERELSLLEDLRELASRGQGQVVGINGGAGTGKSRFLYEFRSLHREVGAAHLHGYCVSYRSGVPYAPLISMIRRASHIQRGDDAATQEAKIRASLELVGCEPEQNLPYLLRLVGLRQGPELLEGMEPQAIQANTFAAMRRMIHSACQHSLVIFEVEDLHWIDRTSEDFLTYLIDTLATARLLVLLTYRTGYEPRWVGRSYATQISMKPLSAVDSQHVVEAYTRRLELSSKVIEEAISRAEGNPLFLEELARSLALGKDGEAQLPGTIQDVLTSRMDRLTTSQKRLLRTAAVLGREFGLDLLAAIWSWPESLDSLLGELQHGEFLYEVPTRAGRTFVFAHALIQEVAYQGLLGRQRRLLHRAAAVALEQAHVGRLERVYDQLIYHYPRARESAKTVEYLRLFAARAARSFAHSEAAEALKLAIEHAEHLDPAECDRTVIALLLDLAESLLPLAAFPETLELFLSHRTRVDGLADAGLAGLFYFWLGHTYSYLGQQEEARSCAERSLEQAREAGAEATEGLACYVLGRDGYWSGRFAEGLEHSLRAVALLERTGQPWWEGQAHWVTGFHHFVLGEFERSLRAMTRARDIGEALADHRLDTSWSIGHLYACLGEWPEGIQRCQEGLDSSQDPLNTAVSKGFLGHALLGHGELEEAISNLEDAAAAMKEAGMQQLLGWFLAFLAEARLVSGDKELARKQALQSLEINRAARFRYGVGLAERTLGRALLAAGDLEEAATRLGEALSTFTSLQVPFEIGRSHFELAGLAKARGEASDQADQLVAAERIFRSLNVPQFVSLVEQEAERDGISLAAPE